ncbi:MAG: CNNM domain-containing protein, partial [Anaerolineae bacterium]
MTWLVIIAAVGTLIGLNSLYVAAEFATVSSRRARLRHMANEGNQLAQWLLPIVTDPSRLDAYVAACQLGITASSLLLGFYGASQVTPAVSSILSGAGVGLERLAPGLTATAVLAFLTSLQVVLGELVPKNVGIRFPEKLALATVRPMRWSMWLFRPLIWLFNGSATLVLRLMGLTPTTEGLHVHSPEEIIMLVEESTAGGLLDEGERRMLERALHWR